MNVTEWTRVRSDPNRRARWPRDGSLTIMNIARDVINVDGEQVVVREDTAKAWRFVHWGVITAAIALGMLAIALATLLWMTTGQGQ